MIRFKRICVPLIFGIVMIGLLGCTMDGKQYSPDQVIENALKKKAPVESYYAEAEMNLSFDGEMDEQMVLKEWRTADGKVRIEMDDNQTDEVVITVNDGTAITTFDAAENQVMIIEDAELVGYQASPKEQAMQVLEMIQDTHDISSEGEEEIAGRITYHLKAKAKQDGDLFGDQEMWIDKESWIVLKLISQSSDMKSEITYTKFDYGIDIPEDKFVLDLPEGVEVINLDGEEEDFMTEVTLSEANELLNKTLHYIPEVDGMTLDKIDMFTLDMEDINRIEIEMEYTKDNLPLFSLGAFESDETLTEADMFPGGELTTIRGKEAYHSDMDDFHMVFWQEQGLNYSFITVDPDLTLADIQQLAETMELVE